MVSSVQGGPFKTEANAKPHHLDGDSGRKGDEASERPFHRQRSPQFDHAESSASLEPKGPM